MPVIILRALHTLSRLILTTFLVVIIPIFSEEKTEARKAKVHTAGE